MPSLTSRAVAELLNLSAYEQMRIVSEQKYPRQVPNNFRTPFYQPALVAIRRFFRSGNDQRIIAQVRQEMAKLRPDSRRSNNVRVLDAFERSMQYVRRLDVRPMRDFEASIDDVTIRLAPDMLVHESGTPRVLFFNCRTVAVPSEVARITIEIADWILEENDAPIRISAIEYIDLVDQVTHTTARRRRSTITKLEANARIIQALWDAA